MSTSTYLQSLPPQATALIERAIRLMASTNRRHQAQAREALVGAAGILVGAGLAPTLSEAVFAIENGAGILIPHPQA